MTAAKYRPTPRLPVIGATRSTMGQIVEVGVAGPHLDSVQVACIILGNKAVSVWLSGPEARALADLHVKAAAIARLVRGREVLMHGTRYPSAILGGGQLLFSRVGLPWISCTRAVAVATHWAELERDDDEGAPAVLILDRRALRARYPLQPSHWNRELPVGPNDEAEEYIAMRDVPDLFRYLTDVVCLERDAERIVAAIVAQHRGYRPSTARSWRGPTLENAVASPGRAEGHA